MSEPPDLNDLAKRYLDLWQEQLGGIGTDDQAAEIMAQTMTLMNAGAANFATMMRAAGHDPGNHDTGNPDEPNTANPASRRPRSPRATSVAAAHGGSDDDVADLARRLERLEERIAALESGAGKKG